MSALVLDKMPPNRAISAEQAIEMDKVIREIPDHQLKSADHGVPGLDDAVSIDPFTTLGRLRDDGHDVVQYIDGAYSGLNAYNAFGRDLAKPNFAVLGYGVLREMVTDPVHFVNAGAYGAHGEAQQAGFTFVNELDGDEHKLMRRLFEVEIFSRTFFLKLVENTIAPVAEFLTLRIRQMLDRGEPVELNRDLALPLAYISISRIIGVPIVDLHYFVDLADRVFGGPRDAEKAGVAAAELDEYFGKVYRDRQASGDLDKGDLMALMSKAERDGRRFSEREIIVYSRFMLPAAIETTFRQSANIGYCLMLHPEQYTLICGDEKLWPSAIEECLRWMSSGFILPRTCAVATTLGGVEIPAGSSMYGIFGVANRDPRIWDNPEAFDVLRPRKPHLTFSMGSHTCMGQQLARMVFTNLLTAMTTNLPDMVLAADPAEMRSTGFVIRCADAVPVKKRA
jgi:cytochrome P450